MIRTVWYISKRGDERTYATTTPPSEQWAVSLRKQGFKILEVGFRVPESYDEAPDDSIEGMVIGAS